MSDKSFDKQSDKNGPCFATGAISSRRAQVGVDWHKSQKDLGFSQNHENMGHSSGRNC